MSEDKLDAKKLFTYLRENKSLWLIAAALIIGAIMIVYGNYEGKTSTVSASVSESSDDYELRLEARVKTLCEQVGGVSNVSVMLTLESLTEQVYAQNLESSESDTSKEQRSEYVQSGSDTLVPTKELTPRVKGVAVVCTGGDDANIQLKLTKLLATLFGIPTSSVSVVGGK